MQHGLGMFQDNPELLEQAANYLRSDYSKNPLHPEFPVPVVVGLSAREPNYEAWAENLLN